MKKFRLITAALLGLVCASAVNAQSLTPSVLVAGLYRAHNGDKSPFFQTKSRSLVNKYFTKSLADLIWKDATDSRGEVGALGADPLYNAQDTEIKRFRVGKALISGPDATVAVTFTNFGEKKTITYLLKREGSAWKIADIKYADQDSLSDWLKAASDT